MWVTLKCIWEKRSIVSTKQNSVKYINYDTLDDKLAQDKLRFIKRNEVMLHKTSVNRDVDDILQPTAIFLNKRTQDITSIA